MPDSRYNTKAKQMIVEPDRASDVRCSRLSLAFAMGPFLVTADSTALITAMPALAGSLHANLAQASITLLIYSLMFAGLILPLGNLMNRIDGFQLLRTGYLLFAAGSLACMVSKTIFWLSAGRCLQGVGGAALYAVAPILIRRVVPAESRDKSYARIVMAGQLGFLIGPPLGGLLTSLLGWQWLFAINLPLSALGYWGLQQWVDQLSPSSDKPPFDLPGALLSFVTCALCIIVLNQGKALGWTSWPFMLILAGFLVSLGLFLTRQATTPYPLINLGLLQNRPYRTGVVIACIAMATETGLSFLYPFFLTTIYKLTTMQSGIMLSIGPLCAVLLGFYAAAATVRWGYPSVISGASWFRLIAAVALAFVVQTPLTGLVILAFGIAGAASGLQYGPLTTTIMAAVPVEHAGDGGALFAQSRLIAQILGILLFETIFTELQKTLSSPHVVTDSRGLAFSVIFAVAACLLAVTALLALRLPEKAEIS